MARSSPTHINQRRVALFGVAKRPDPEITQVDRFKEYMTARLFRFPVTGLVATMEPDAVRALNALPLYYKSLLTEWSSAQLATTIRTLNSSRSLGLFLFVLQEVVGLLEIARDYSSFIELCEHVFANVSDRPITRFMIFSLRKNVKLLLVYDFGERLVNALYTKLLSIRTIDVVLYRIILTFLMEVKNSPRLSPVAPKIAEIASAIVPELKPAEVACKSNIDCETFDSLGPASLADYVGHYHRVCFESPSLIGDFIRRLAMWLADSTSDLMLNRVALSADLTEEVLLRLDKPRVPFGDCASLLFDMCLKASGSGAAAVAALLVALLARGCFGALDFVEVHLLPQLQDTSSLVCYLICVSNAIWLLS